ncbi:MAG: GrpB family protein [Candidatus Cloacimonetes bacterium]|nr:GrpB family protein [Candidatus Cloacimonadota bacterium]
MIGLEKNVVKLVEYQSEWISAFKKEADRIASFLNDEIVDIQHIGSTAIEGMTAKPIIDMLVGVKKLERIISDKSLLENKDYTYRENHSTPERLFFIKGKDFKRTHHIHIVEWGSREWYDKICFRDYLIDNPSVADEYQLLKQKLAEKFRDNRENYTSGKSDFINMILNNIKDREVLCS